ncbi:MAG: DUF120 domain-containing protein [Candidatus Bathyarchaeia archaeon]
MGTERLGENRNITVGLIVRGTVSTGIGEGSKFTNLPWFKRQVKEALGFEPHPGTLNLLLADEDCNKLMDLLSKNSGFKIVPEPGYSSGRLYRALIMPGISGAVVRPNVSNYPRKLLEIIAPVNLRRLLNLRDGDEVEVEILLE